MSPTNRTRVSSVIDQHPKSVVNKAIVPQSTRACVIRTKAAAVWSYVLRNDAPAENSDASFLLTWAPTTPDTAHCGNASSSLSRSSSGTAIHELYSMQYRLIVSYNCYCTGMMSVAGSRVSPNLLPLSNAGICCVILSPFYC